MVTGCPGLTTAPCQSAVYREGAGHLGIVAGCLVTPLTAAPGKRGLPSSYRDEGMGWKTSFQPRRRGSIDREEPARFPVSVSRCSTYRWLRWLRRQKPRGSGEPFISSAGSLQSIKKHYRLAWRKSRRENQVQINAGRKESFLPLSSLSSPDVTNLSWEEHGAGTGSTLL